MIELREIVGLELGKEINDAINNNQKPINWEYTAVIEEIQVAKAEMVNQRIQFKHINREANMVAHWIAKNEMAIVNRGLFCYLQRELSTIL